MDGGGVTEPVAAARDRVASLLERLTRVNLQVVVVARPEATRMAARDRAWAAAVTAGRADLFGEATAAARETTLRAFSRAGFSGTWAATDWSVSVVNANDRVAAAAAFEEAAMAEVVDDLVDDETLEVLRSSSDELVRSSGVPTPGALSSVATPNSMAIRGPIQLVAVIAFIAVCATIWLTVGGAAGFTALVLGLLLAGGFARSRGRTDA